MPQLIINITEEQKTKILNHYAQIGHEITDECPPVPPNFCFKIEYFLNFAEFTVAVYDVPLEIGSVETNFWQILQ